MSVDVWKMLVLPLVCERGCMEDTGVTIGMCGRCFGLRLILCARLACVKGALVWTHPFLQST